MMLHLKYAFLQIRESLYAITKTTNTYRLLTKINDVYEHGSNI